MATEKIIGQIEVASGNVKIIGVDGVVREAVYGGFMYEGEQVVSIDPSSLFQIRYLAFSQATTYEGVFRVLADGSVISDAEAMDSIASDENLMDLLKTAAGEEDVEGSSAYIPTDIVAESSVQGLSRDSENLKVTGISGLDAGARPSDDVNDFAPTADDKPVADVVLSANNQPVVTDIDANSNVNLNDNPTWLLGASTMPMYWDDIDGKYGINPYYDVDGASDGDINDLIYIDDDSVDISDLFSDNYPEDGSAIKFTIEGETGDVVTFNWTFNDVEGEVYEEVYNDFSFVVVDGKPINGEPAGLLADVSTDGYTNHGVFTYTFEDDDSHEITFGVMNGGGDDSYDSSLQITHVSGGIIVDTQSVGYVQYMNIPGEIVSVKPVPHAVITGNIVQLDEEEDSGSIDYWHFTHSGGPLTIDMLTEYGDADLNNDGEQSELDSYIYLYKDTGVFDEDSLIAYDDDSFDGENDSGGDEYGGGGGADGSVDSYDSYLNFDDLDAGNYVLVVGGYDLYEESVPARVNYDSDYEGPYQVTFTSGSAVSFIVYETGKEINTIFVGVIDDIVQDADIDDTHTYEVVAGTVAINGEIVDDALATIYFNDESGNWEYRVEGDFNYLSRGEIATVTFNYVAIDSSGVGAGGGVTEPDTSDPATITLEITGTSDAPTITKIADYVIVDGEDEVNTVLPFVIDAGMLLTNDSDVDIDTLHIELEDDYLYDIYGDEIGEVSINEDGDVYIEPYDIGEVNNDSVATFRYIAVAEDDNGDYDESDIVTATVDVELGTVTNTGEVNYVASENEFIIGTDSDSGSDLDEVELLSSDNILTVDGTLDLSNVSDINTVQLDADATVTGSSDLGHINPGDVMNATDAENTLIIQSSSEGGAADQVDVHESFGIATLEEVNGTYYDAYTASYGNGIATLLIEIDEPIDGLIG
jgi:hypothetical protein